VEGRRQKDEGRRTKVEGGRQKDEGGRWRGEWSVIGNRWSEEGRRQKDEGGVSSGECRGASGDEQQKAEGTKGFDPEESGLSAPRDRDFQPDGQDHVKKFLSSRSQPEGKHVLAAGALFSRPEATTTSQNHDFGGTSRHGRFLSTRRHSCWCLAKPAYDRQARCPN